MRRTIAFKSSSNRVRGRMRLLLPMLGLALVACTSSPASSVQTADQSNDRFGGSSSGAPLAGSYGAGGGSTSTVLGSNPTSVGYAGHLLVQPIYPGPTAATVAISGSPPQTILALVEPNVVTTAVSASANVGYTTQALTPESSQDRLEARMQHVTLGAPSFGFHLQSTAPNFQLPSSIAVGQTIGHIEVATQDSSGNQGETAITGTIEAVNTSPNFVIVVDNADLGTANLGTIVANLQSTFANHIYPTDTANFGTDPTAAAGDAVGLGLQADPLFIVVSHQVSTDTDTGAQNGNLGYFTLGDFLPATGTSGEIDPESNEVKAIFISPNALTDNPQTTYATVAHEFQHMLFSWNRVQTIGLANHIDEFNSEKIAWINEGMSMLAMELNGYGPDAASQVGAGILGHISYFLGSPSQFSLTDFYQAKGNPDDDYGEAELFADLLYKTFGSTVMQAIERDPQFRVNPQVTANSTPGTTDYANISSTAMVDDALRTRFGSGMASFFETFAATLYLSGTPAASGTPYEFAHVDLRASYTDPSNGQPYNFTGPATVPMTGGSYGGSLKSWATVFAMPTGAYGHLTYSLSTPGEGDLILFP